VHDEPVDLDARRGRAGLIATENRRKMLHDRGTGADDTAVRAAENAEHELEVIQPALLGEPMASWVAGAAKARYLLLQYARTREGQTRTQARLIKQTLNNLSALVDAAQETAEKAGEEGEE